MTIPRDMPPDMPPKPPTAHAGERARRASRLAGVVLLLFMLAAILSNAWWSREHRLLPDNLSMQRLLDGDVTHDIAQRLGDMPFSNQAATLQRGLGWLTLGDLGERVRSGCPGWLFLADELQVHPQAEANARARAQTVLQTRQALATQGVDLLVAVVPDKSRVEADRLCGLHRPAAFEHRLQAWADMLRAEGVKVLDLTSALQAGEQEAFLRADSHWSQAGAGAAALAVAEQVRAAGVPLQPEREYDVSTGPPALRPGDLVRLAGIDGLPQRWQPETDVVAPQRYTPLAAAADDADALFGDAGTPTLALVGTSFSRTSEFAPQLARELGVEIGNFARDGAKFGAAAQAYFKSPAWKQTPPRLVIWEIDERDLQAPLTDDDKPAFGMPQN